MTINPIEVPDWIRSVLIFDPTDIWGNVVGMGLAELAAVLSPAKRFDRRGDVIFWEDFENGLSKCNPITFGTGAQITVSSTYSRWGGLSARIVGGSDASLNAYLEFYLAFLPKTKIGCEAAFRLQANANIYQKRIYYYDGSRVHHGGIRFNATLDRWQYLDTADVWQTLLTGVYLEDLMAVFHLAKLVIDPVNDKYVRALLNEKEVDMSAYTLPTSVSGTVPHLFITEQVISDTGANGSMYLDSVIVTQNEPV